MKLVKHRHACLVLEKDGASLVIDPGTLSRDFIMPRHVVGIVITHEHLDHFDEALVTAILKKHPKAAIIAHGSIAGRFTEYQTLTATPDAEPIVVGPFTLAFYGGTHASIAPSITAPPNIGVLVDNSLYYPGDSFVVPEGVKVQVLALPVSAPWLKISESLEFLARVHPAIAFPTHDGILSQDGKAIVDRLVGATASSLTVQYKRLDNASVEL